MAEKTNFSVVNGAPPPPDVKCCGNCTHARLSLNPQVMKEVAECRALPPTAMLLATSQGMGATFRWPVLQVTDECDYFHPKTVSDTPAETSN